MSTAEDRKSIELDHIGGRDGGEWCVLIVLARVVLAISAAEEKLDVLREILAVVSCTAHYLRRDGQPREPDPG
ncbi:hypothetical protein P3H15_51990 [Rhodococcus sp. T2V]|uniref:hypothetical protein n=1 Tax=Rhodococcus sp. T2V TaxID=3034164 RepID=UPI0023E29E18|nr:hypothetical protein [Rhodococcus sp. T2V]MDF3313433.1 hypothetical protein [Rhodococcus sp. T2V]